MRTTSWIQAKALMAIVGIATVGACSSTPAQHQTGTAGTTGTSGTSGTAGTSGAAGTTGTSGTSGTAGTTGTSGTSGAAGATGAAGAGAAGATGTAGSDAGAPSDGSISGTASELAKGPYTCTEYIGAYLTMEWYGLGFENIVENAKWQLKWHHHGHVLNWADPNSPMWADTGDPMNDQSGSPITSACAQNTHAPDRVVLLTLSWELPDEQSWMDALNGDISTIKLKYPSVKWIDLMPMVRCPMNKMCNPNENYGPGADTDVGRQDCYVEPFEDSALKKVVAAHAADPVGVGLGPILEATMCNNNGAHLTGADDKLESNEIGAYYKALP